MTSPGQSREAQHRSGAARLAIVVIAAAATWLLSDYLEADRLIFSRWLDNAYFQPSWIVPAALVLAGVLALGAGIAVIVWVMHGFRARGAETRG